ncbi:MAG: hypothetical protein Q4B04_01895 [bacterium]|nr:hypothetical protein [bacterium]
MTVEKIILWCSLDIFPAAAGTIYNFLLDIKTTAKDYDLILTGDPGVVGNNF